MGDFSFHFRGRHCARIQVHGAVSLKTQRPDTTRKGFCDFRMSGEQPRQPKDLQGLLKFCMEATANEDAPALPGDPAARLAAMEPDRRAWLEEALDKMSVDVLAPLTNEEVEGILEELDEDGSGSMDFDEFCEMMMTKPERVQILKPFHPCCIFY